MEFNSISGAIKLDRDYERSINFIKTLGKDDYYPFINTNMFSYGDYEIPYYYEYMMLSFGATYKGFGLELHDWNNLVLKIEHILRNIDFKIAQFHVDSFLGDFTLTWMHKKRFYPEDDYLRKEIQFKKTDEWYFGYGVRDMTTGWLRHEFAEHDSLEHLGIGFSYPIVFDPAAIDFVRQQFNKTFHLPVGSAIDARLKYGDPLGDRVDEILYSLVLAGKIEFADSNLGMEKIIIQEQPWFV